MFVPVTQAGITFNELFTTLVERLDKLGSDNTAQAEEISVAVIAFFQSVQHLVKSLRESKIIVTELFEIDQTLLGRFNDGKLIEDSTQEQFRRLLRDLIVLWYRYVILANLSQSNIVLLNIPAIQSFFETWKASERVGLDQPEQERLIVDIAILLTASDYLNVETRIRLFGIIGEIGIALGADQEWARQRLMDYADDIYQRNLGLSGQSFAEILLCLYVIWQSGSGFESSVGEIALRKAVRFWSSGNTFLEALFKAWNLYVEHDYSSPLLKGDQLRLKEASSLYRAILEKKSRLGIGHSFSDLARRNGSFDAADTLFQPIQIFLLGGSGAGKSSFLTAFSYDVKMRGGTSALTLGKELQAHYERNSPAWHEGRMPPSTDYQNFTFWRDLNVAAFSMMDYGGSVAQPEQWDRELQERFNSARGLLFFVESAVYTDPDALRQYSDWLATLLEYWTKSNQDLRNMPVALVLTKCDQVLGDAMAALTRSSLLPRGFQPALVEQLLEHRYNGGMAKRLQSPYGRLCDAIINDKANNREPRLQDIVQNIVDNCERFFAKLLERTYNYQIFLSASSSPKATGNDVLPFGISEPLAWLIDILELNHIQESLTMFNAEADETGKSIEFLKEDYASMQRARADIDEAVKEIDELRPRFWVLGKDDRINSLEHKVESANARFRDIFKRVVNDEEEPNKTAALQSVENQLRKKETFLKELHAKRADYETVLLSLQAADDRRGRE